MEEVVPNPEDQEYDMSGVSTEFKALPEAIYDSVTEEVTLEHTDGDLTKPYLAYVFVIPSQQNRKAWLNASLQSQSLWKVKKTLEALGIDASGKLTVGQMITLSKGRPCKLYLAVKIFEGKERNEVAEVLPAEGGTPQPSF